MTDATQDHASTGFRFDGLTVLVTGASRGIGLALATAFLDAGARVILAARNPESLEAARRALAEAHGAERVVAQPLDVASPEGVEEAVDRMQDAAGVIDALVNNAGRQVRAPLIDLPATDWDEVLRTNVTGAFLVGRAVARGMIERGSGAIVNIASIQADLARPSIGAYTASKGAVRTLTRAMAAEWAGRGVRVNAVAPGYIRTDMTRALVDDPAFDGWVRGRTPAGRWGEVADVVGPVLWLCSDAATFVHGQTIFVDGGMSVVV